MGRSSGLWDYTLARAARGRGWFQDRRKEQPLSRLMCNSSATSASPSAPGSCQGGTEPGPGPGWAREPLGGHGVGRGRGRVPPLGQGGGKPPALCSQVILSGPGPAQSPPAPRAFPRCPPQMDVPFPLLSSRRGCFPPSPHPPQVLFLEERLGQEFPSGLGSGAQRPQGGILSLLPPHRSCPVPPGLPFSYHPSFPQKWKHLGRNEPLPAQL